MAAAWTYSDWRLSSLYPIGSVARQQRLEQHIKEVSDFISTGNFSIEGRSQNKDSLQKYLESLEGQYATVVAETQASSEDGTTFVRGVPTGPGGGAP